VSNASIIQRMQVLLDNYHAGGLSGDQFVSAVYSHLDALEFVNYDAVRRGRDLCHELVHDQLWSEEEFDDPRNRAEVLAVRDAALAEFRRYLDQLPVAHR
jgi:hypothetical protein